ncbi:MAG: hypothetical protein NWE89_04700 [Candidatus Bathyarchaeota archaeon]|nr:hypothetical protein [Candidatus Bathyarchaeota archaeon]
MRRRYPHNRILEKAEMLVRNDRVERLDNDRFNVIGNHGTYNVVKDHNGVLSCTCPGYREKRRCSHSFAVQIYTSKRRSGKSR